MGFLDEFAEQPKELISRISKTIETTADRILAFIPEEKRKPALICAGVTIFLLILVIAVSLVQQPETVREFPERSPFVISGDELFLPEEPDFLPVFLLEREPRSSWTLDDIRPLWKDPGQGRLDYWREEMSAAIDRLMETVP